MLVIPELPAGRYGVVCLVELLGAGWTYEAIRHAVRTERLEWVARGRYAPPPPEHLGRFRQADLRLLRCAVAAAVPADRVAVSHLAAAVHQDLPIWADLPRACVSTWNVGLRRCADLHVHRLLDTSALVRRGGVPVTSTARTIVDIACEFGTEAALVSGDVALRTGVLTLDALDREVQRASGSFGIEHARRVGPLLDRRAESPLESRSRWKFDVHGIEQPVSQVWIYTIGGKFLGRVDHFWPEGVVGEADGAAKYPDGSNSLQLEKIRQQGLEDVDLEVARWGTKDMRDFTAAAGRIERARARARHRLVEGNLQWYALDSHGARVLFPGVNGA